MSHSLDQERLLRRCRPGISAWLCLGGPPGAHRAACRLVGEYEFADARILRGVYLRNSALLGRNMLLEGRFFGLRFYFGVRVTGVIDEERDAGNGPERVWGWCYQTLEGHFEQGRLSLR